MDTTSIASWWQINLADEIVMKHVAIDSLPSPCRVQSVFALLSTFSTLLSAYLFHFNISKGLIVFLMWQQIYSHVCSNLGNIFATE